MTTEITELKRIDQPALPPAPRGRVALKWLPAVLPVALCAALARHLPRWIYMWLLAASIFAAAKWVTIVDARPWRDVSWRRMTAYLFLWPGLDFRRFQKDRSQQAPTVGEWIWACAKTLVGAALVWGVLLSLPPAHPILIGWMGMLGIAFVLHFGLFHILSNVWRAAGCNAPPLMTNPIQAASLAEFWGSRWNKAFHDIVAPHVFAPLARRFGTATAVLAVFLFSGLLHEMVISLPARGGFGLPTLYFTVQGAGLLGERSRLGRKLGLGRGFRGWLFTAVVSGGPAYWLLHPIFLRHVILPMLRAVGAI